MTGRSADLDAASSYRQRAEELRVIAELTASKANRIALLKVAEDYERMAECRLRIDATNKRKGRG